MALVGMVDSNEWIQAVVGVRRHLSSLSEVISGYGRQWGGGPEWNYRKVVLLRRAWS